MAGYDSQRESGAAISFTVVEIEKKELAKMADFAEDRTAGEGPDDKDNNCDMRTGFYSVVLWLFNRKTAF